MIKTLFNEKLTDGYTVARYRLSQTEYALERRGLISFARNPPRSGLVRVQITPSGVAARQANAGRHHAKAADVVFYSVPQATVLAGESSVCAKPARKQPPATKAQRSRLGSIVNFKGEKSQYGGICVSTRLIAHRSLNPLKRKGLIKVWLNPDTLLLEYAITVKGALVAEV
jgi:hypothetical protein